MKNPQTVSFEILDRDKKMLKDYVVELDFSDIEEGIQAEIEDFLADYRYTYDGDIEEGETDDLFARIKDAFSKDLLYEAEIEIELCLDEEYEDEDEGEDEDEDGPFLDDFYWEIEHIQMLSVPEDNVKKTLFNEDQSVQPRLDLGI